MCQLYSGFHLQVNFLPRTGHRSSDSSRNRYENMINALVWKTIRLETSCKTCQGRSECIDIAPLITMGKSFFSRDKGASSNLGLHAIDRVLIEDSNLGSHARLSTFPALAQMVCQHLAQHCYVSFGLSSLLISRQEESILHRQSKMKSWDRCPLAFAHDTLYTTETLVRTIGCS